MPSIDYVSGEALDTQTKNWVRLIGAILPSSNSFCFLAVDVTLLQNYCKLRQLEQIPLNPICIQRGRRNSRIAQV
jgi:hypothetical protein